MSSSFLYLLAALSVVNSAQAQASAPITTSVLFPPNLNPETTPTAFDASVVELRPTGTVLRLNCPARETNRLCANIASAMTVTASPSQLLYNAQFDVGPGGQLSINGMCSASGSVAVCEASAGGVGANTFTQPTTATFTNLAAVPVTITAGLEKLSAVPTVSASTGPTTMSNDTAAQTPPASTGAASNTIVALGSLVGAVGAMAAAFIL